MCGIVGYIGDRKATDVIIKGLRRLEYRGYDSAGIAILNQDKISLTKCEGKVNNLESLLDDKNTIGSMGLGHTRWATHGFPNDINAHPHQDNSGKFTLVHNGIIENYSTLRQLLKDNGINCKTETDTEVLVQFIGYLYKKDHLYFAEAVRLALNKVIGAYGIVVLCEDEPEKIIAARFGSPLVLGIGKDEMFVASDTSPIIEYTRNIIYLAEGELAVIEKSDYEVRNIHKNHIVNKEIEKIEYSLEQIEKGGYEHFMLKEIIEQPKSVSDALRGRINYHDGLVILGGIRFYTKHFGCKTNLHNCLWHFVACCFDWWFFNRGIAS